LIFYQFKDWKPPKIIRFNP